MPSGGEHLNVRKTGHIDIYIYIYIYHSSHCRLDGETSRSHRRLPATCWAGHKSLEHQPEGPQSLTAAREPGDLPPVELKSDNSREDTL